MSFARYPAYKDSGVEWLGEVPAHWEVRRLRHAVQLNPSKSEVRHLPGKTEVSFLPMEAIGDDGSLDRERSRPISEVESGYTYFRDGDVTIAKITPCFENGKGAVMRDLLGGIGFGTTELIVARPDDAVVSSEYLDRIFNSHPFRRLGEAAMYGAGGQKRVPDDFVRDFAIALPPREEQADIETFLDRETAKIDALVAEQERLIALLKEKRQAVISHAVTKGLDPSVPMKDSGVKWLGEVPAHWEVRPIRRASTFVTSGPRGWSDFISEEGTLFVQSGDLDDEQNVLWQSAKRVNLNQADLAEAARTRLLEGDVVVCITGAKTGNVAIVRDVTEPAHINQHLCLIRPTAEVRAAFMGRYLASETGQRFLLLAQYGLKQGLGLDDIKSVSMPVPPVDEQDEIALTIDHLSGQMNQLMSHAQTVIATLQERRSALISAAVTGQIDVRGAPEQAP